MQSATNLSIANKFKHDMTEFQKALFGIPLPLLVDI
jgi:hypothetical protein